MEVNERQVFKLNTAIKELKDINGKEYKNYEKMIKDINNELNISLDRYNSDQYAAAVDTLHNDNIVRAETIFKSPIYQSAKGLYDSIFEKYKEEKTLLNKYNNIMSSDTFKKANEIINSEKIISAKNFLESKQVLDAEKLLSGLENILAEEMLEDIEILQSNEFKTSNELMKIYEVIQSDEFIKLSSKIDRSMEEKVNELNELKEQVKILNSKSYKNAASTAKKYKDSDKIIKDILDSNKDDKHQLSDKIKKLDELSEKLLKIEDEESDEYITILIEKETIEDEIKKSEELIKKQDSDNLQTIEDLKKSLIESDKLLKSLAVEKAKEIKASDKFKRLSSNKEIKDFVKNKKEFDNKFGNVLEKSKQYNFTDFKNAQTYINSKKIQRIINSKNNGDYATAINHLNNSEYVQAKELIKSADYKNAKMILNYDPEYIKALEYINEIDVDKINKFYASDKVKEFKQAIESDKFKNVQNIIENNVINNILKVLSSPEYILASTIATKFTKEKANVLIGKKLINITKKVNKVPLLYKGYENVKTKIINMKSTQNINEISNHFNNEEGEFKNINIIDIQKNDDKSFIIYYIKTN